MPRVNTKTKNKAGKEYRCGKCQKRIEPGTKYYEWSFRYGGTHRQHEDCGRPKQSQLTQSKLSTVYAAIEDAESTISSAGDVDEMKDALESVKDAATEVAEEYEQAMEAMGAAGESGEMAERKDALESFASDIEDVSDSLDEDEPTEEDLDEEKDEDTEKDCPDCKGEGDSDEVEENEDGSEQLAACSTCDGAGHVPLTEDELKARAADEEQRIADLLEEKKQEWLEEKRDAALSALGELSI